MEKERLTAFSDGVIAIIVTIMVLELKAPHDPSPGALLGLAPVFSAYVLSFVHVAIYWNNHHHLFQTVERVNGRILWANTNLLFWLSLVPFSTAWMSENHFAPTPVAVYGFTLLMPALAYYVLTRMLVSVHAEESTLVRAVGRIRKELLSLALYGAAISVAFFQPYVSLAIYVLVAALWAIPDQRIEKAVKEVSEASAD
jgi:uncharacterized membrane protein